VDLLCQRYRAGTEEQDCYKQWKAQCGERGGKKVVSDDGRVSYLSKCPEKDVTKVLYDAVAHGVN